MSTLRLVTDSTALPADDDPPADLRALVRRVAAGDADAFEPLYRAHGPRVYALCLRMTGDSALAAELTQDTFVRAWERIASFRGDSSFGTWLHQLAVNVVLAHARSGRRRAARVTSESDVGALPAASTRPAFDERMDLDAAIATLPPGARSAFVLHDVEGYTHEEIARQTGVAAGTVRAQLFRARQLLIRILS